MKNRVVAAKNMTHVRRGKRSKQRYVHRIVSWDEQKTDYDRANDLILQYCFHDIVNRDKVFTVQTEAVIREQIESEFGGQVPSNVVFLVDNKEYGEILNRFPLRVFPMYSYFVDKSDRGVIQK